jgi:hypothetical protein
MEGRCLALALDSLVEDADKNVFGVSHLSSKEDKVEQGRFA